MKVESSKFRSLSQGVFPDDENVVNLAGYCLNQHVKTAHHAQAQYHAAPKCRIVQHPPSPNQLTPLQRHDRQLQHHGKKPIPAKFLGDAAHDQLVAQRTDQESNDHGHGRGKVRLGREEDVPAQEMVDGDVPLAAEFEPVAGIPPIRVKMAVGEAGDFREGAEDVFPDDKEDEEESDHEGEEHQAGGLRQDQGFIRERVDQFQTGRRVCQDGRDEFLTDCDH